MWYSIIGMWLILAIALSIGAQGAPPNALPSSASKESSVSHRDADPKTSEAPQSGSYDNPISPCTKSIPCYVIQQPETKTKEEQAKADSLDTLTRCYMWATIIGVIGGWIGISLVYGQFRSQKGATEAAMQAARSADRNADILINSERAWLLAESIPSGPHKKEGRWYWENGAELTDLEIITRKNKPEIIGYTIKNYGRTPGWITSHWATARIVASAEGLPRPPDYFTKPASIFTQDVSIVYVPGQSKRNIILVPYEDLAPTAKRERFLYVYGTFTYRDVAERSHETRFCFFWHVPPEGDLNPQGFYQEGPEGYNRET
jgi:hypothetical protein